jgi:hypothetical protein
MRHFALFFGEVGFQTGDVRFQSRDFRFQPMVGGAKVHIAGFDSSDGREHGNAGGSEEDASAASGRLFSALGHNDTGGLKVKAAV